MSLKHKVLVVDDEPLVLSMLQESLRRHLLDVQIAKRGAEAIKSINRRHFDLVITDVKLPDISGMEVLREARKLKSMPGVILMTGFATVEDAVEAMKYGAYDYITKPFELDHFEGILNTYFRDLSAGNVIFHLDNNDETLPGYIIGKSAKMLQIFGLIKRVAPTNSTVLLQGESGTGKEVFASTIHELSLRRHSPFVKLNCAAIPSNLVESELFGHEKGAFTGAVNRRDGKFFTANSGTILLDEITEMDIHLQAKLLRVLQEREFEPVGSNKSRTVDVRVIATSNKNLKELVSQGAFREDLYYRLNVVPVTIPPLRDRKEDIPFLVEYFVRKICDRNRQLRIDIDPDLFDELKSYSWPGNVRQLENAVERAIVTNYSTILTKQSFEFLKHDEISNMPFDPSLLVGMTCSEVEKLNILETLFREKGNRTKAAEKLGINVRTLRNKIKEYSQGGIASKYLDILKMQ